MPEFRQQLTTEKPKVTFEERLKRIFNNPFAMIGILIVILVLVIGGVAVRNYFEDAYDQKIRVTNYQILKNVPATEVQTGISESLFKIVRLNFSELSEEAVGIAAANVREETFLSYYDIDTGLYMNKFIVDIPALEQNYSVFYPAEGVTREVAKTGCLTPDEYVYPFYLCLSEDVSLETAYIEYLNNILPFKGYTEADAAFYVGKFNHTTHGDPFLRVEVNACGDSFIADGAQEILENYIREHYLNPEDYDYKIADLCDGGGM